MIDYSGKCGSVTAVHLTGHSETIFVANTIDDITRDIEKTRDVA